MLTLLADTTFILDSTHAIVLQSSMALPKAWIAISIRAGPMNTKIEPLRSGRDDELKPGFVIELTSGVQEHYGRAFESKH